MWVLTEAGHYVAAGPGYILFYVTTIHPGRHAAPDKRLLYSFMPLWYTFWIIIVICTDYRISHFVVINAVGASLAAFLLSRAALFFQNI